MDLHHGTDQEKAPTTETVGFRFDDDRPDLEVLVEMDVTDAATGEELERAGLGDWAKRRAKITFDEALSAIPVITKAVREQIESVPEPPDEVTLSVGLKFTGGTSVKIVSGKTESHLNLQMKWKR